MHATRGISTFVIASGINSSLHRVTSVRTSLPRAVIRYIICTPMLYITFTYVFTHRGARVFVHFLERNNFFTVFFF